MSFLCVVGAHLSPSVCKGSSVDCRIWRAGLLGAADYQGGYKPGLKMQCNEEKQAKLGILGWLSWDSAMVDHSSLHELRYSRKTTAFHVVHCIVKQTNTM